MSAEEAASLVEAGSVVGFSGFTLVGYPTQVPAAMARLGKARDLTVLTGASVGDELDGALARAGLVKFRAPYQSHKDLRAGINEGRVGYEDFHLSHLPAMLNRGVGPKLDWAVVECSGVTEEGIVPTASVGASDSFVRCAGRVILELNEDLPDSLYGMHDIYRVGDGPIPVRSPSDRIGLPHIPCEMEKIAAIVRTGDSGSAPRFKEPDEISRRISENIVGFLKEEVRAGRLPANLRPLQSGVGNVANAVLGGLGKDFRDLSMYTEVMQDSAFHLVRDGVITRASTTALSLSREAQAEFYANMDYYRERIVIRPQEIANHPEIVRRLQLISMNTPIEVDLYGNVNSTHVMGSRIMNGIGGSGDFARNAGLTIFSTGSLAKNGDISCIVPMVSHVDHTEHDVDVIVTEQGVADLRWKTPRERARLLIENCAHPDYRDALRDYFERACREVGGQTPHLLGEALSWHRRYQESGSMKG